MTAVADAAEFADRLRAGMQEFRLIESQLRHQYARSHGLSPETMPLDMLERPTRRFLIDHFLRALDWDPDEPGQVIEEARARSTDQDRLYFDYLGISPGTRAPIVIVEAKGFDVSKPRRARGPELAAKEMGRLICDAVFALKDLAQGDSGIMAEWAEYLRDLRSYVAALDDFGKSTLQRVVISAGNWIIVFEDPVSCFFHSGRPDTERVHCFPSGDEILLRHTELFEMLHRRRLVDCLPLTLDIGEALEFLSPGSIRDCYRAVLIATSASSGAARRKYPTRSVYPVLLVRSSDRWFAIFDLDRGVEEPRGVERLDGFLRDLERTGDHLEARLRARLGIPLTPSALEQFPGFPAAVSRQRSMIREVPPLPESTAARAPAVPERIFVVPSGEQGAPAEYVVVTGVSWFYKTDRASTPSVCAFHFWKSARNENVANAGAIVECSVSSFTEDGQDRHCAHGDLRRLRAQRCHVRPVESHLCCHACSFASICWANDNERLPCPRA